MEIKDKILVTVATDLNHTYESASDIIGREGEGNISRLKIAIPDKLSDYAVYIDFKKPNGEKIRTPQLKVESGVATYDVPLYLLSDSGELKVQLVFQNRDGTIWKSSKKRYFIQKSINALDDIPEGEKEDFLTEAQKVINQLSGEVTAIAELLSDDEDFVDAVISKLENPTYVNTIENSPLKFFVGTQAQYDALFASEKEGLFAIITDDTAKDELFQTIEDLKEAETANIDRFNVYNERISNIESDFDDLKNNIKWQPPLLDNLGGQLNNAGYHIVNVLYGDIQAFLCFGVVYWDGMHSTTCPSTNILGVEYTLDIGSDGSLTVFKIANNTHSTLANCTFYVNRLGGI